VFSGTLCLLLHLGRLLPLLLLLLLLLYCCCGASSAAALLLAAWLLLARDGLPRRHCPHQGCLQQQNAAQELSA
jgi:hypothetical protein